MSAHCQKCGTAIEEDTDKFCQFCKSSGGDATSSTNMRTGPSVPGDATINMQGRRIDNPSGLPTPGDYGKDQGHWYACAPRCVTLAPNDAHNLFIANLGRHDVVEHEDGTLTVSPSILITRHDGQWHGYLERGVWREC